MEITVDKEKMAEQLQALTTLSIELENNKSKEYNITSKGETADYMVACVNGYCYLEEALLTLMNATSRFLQNASDGFIDADDMLSDLFKQVKGSYDTEGGQQ